jgi:hypothetical protein
MIHTKRKNEMKLLLMMLLSSCMHNDSVFYDKITDDFDRNSWFISIELKSSDYNGKVIIENDDLFYYFNQTEKVDKEQYKKLIKERLESNSSIISGKEDLVKFNFTKVPIIESVNKNAKKGLDKFIQIYFDGKVLKDGIADYERTAIIQKLFEWKIPTKIDDETGYLILSR